MENWSLANLRAHQQFTLGRIDSLRWVLDRIDVLTEDEDLSPEKYQIETRIRDHQATEQECERLIQKILDGRETVKQQRLEDKLAAHETFGSK